MKELKFSHITKTGGTSIENIARLKNIYWGRYDINFNNNWHIPLKELPIEIKKKYDWFIVCRNPYNRILSEYHCNWGGIGALKISHDKKQFNKYIRYKIMNRRKLKCFGHYLEQYLYFIQGVKILRFENLKNDFDKLMKKYNLKLELNIKVNSNRKIFSVKDFDDETIKLINQVYDKDFKIFKYQKINI